MIILKSAVRASVIVMFLICSIPLYAKEGFTAEKFLQFTKAAQASYFQTSVTMAGVIATQTRKDLARCIDEWYFGDAQTIQKRNTSMRALMKKYPKHHPSGIIAAAIERACGSFSNRD